eukprot:m.137369 g.137369  ORF g.137369 m.137369 type:complete len:80 (+) comp16994_c2_seq3:438-677(+)
MWNLHASFLVVPDINRLEVCYGKKLQEARTQPRSHAKRHKKKEKKKKHKKKRKRKSDDDESDEEAGRLSEDAALRDLLL